METSQITIVSDIRNVLQDLEIIELQHAALLDETSEADAAESRSERIEVIQGNMEKIALAQEEAQLMIDMSAFWNTLAFEKDKADSEVQVLREKNAKLQEEFEKSVQQVAQLVEDNKHLDIEISKMKCANAADRNHEEQANTLPTPSISVNRNTAEGELVNENNEPKPENEHCQVAGEQKPSDLQSQGSEKTDELKSTASFKQSTALYDRDGHCKNTNLVCARAIAISEQILGKGHPGLATQLNNFALICQNQGQFADAAKHYQRAVQIYETSCDADHSNIEKLQSNLACCYLKQNKYEAAAALFKEILTKAHIREHGAIDKSNKPIWLFAEEREQQSNENYVGTVNVQHVGGGQKLLSLNSYAVITAVYNLAELYRCEGKFVAAETLESCGLRSVAADKFLK